MNTYFKFLPNVFLAKCTEKHAKGETIAVTTKYGKENQSIIYNLIFEKENYYYYSIVRADGYNIQERAKNKAEKLINASINAEQKSQQKMNAADKHRDFLILGEPIKIGHHSEGRHRRIIEQSNNNIKKAVELDEAAKEYIRRAAYWEKQSNVINLSMPESIEYYAYKLEKAKEKHKGLLNGTIDREHSFSLTYAKKDVNELEKLYNNAKKLWG